MHVFEYFVKKVPIRKLPLLILSTIVETFMTVTFFSEKVDGRRVCVVNFNFK